MLKTFVFRVYEVVVLANYSTPITHLLVARVKICVLKGDSRRNSFFFY
jgi:hypothetical protein